DDADLGIVQMLNDPRGIYQHLWMRVARRGRRAGCRRIRVSHARSLLYATQSAYPAALCREISHAQPSRTRHPRGPSQPYPGGWAACSAVPVEDCSMVFNSEQIGRDYLWRRIGE